MQTYAGEFEVHLTVRAESPEGLGEFQSWCARQGVKCVRIVLSRGAHVEQPMATWHRHQTELERVVAEAQQMAGDARTNGMAVTRVKVEAAPDNLGVPIDDTDAASHDVDNYFEHHIKLRRLAEQSESQLASRCELHGAHLSRNAFRQSHDGVQERFVTLRSYGVGRLASDRSLRQLLATLAELNEEVIETESEYCVYDSNLALDNGWLP